MELVLATVVLICLVAQTVIYNRFKHQLRQEKAQSSRLKKEVEFIQKELMGVITRRKRLLAASTQALIIVESNHHISSANKVARNMFGKLDDTTTFTEWTRHHKLRELIDQTLDGKKTPPIYFSRGENIFEAHARFIKVNKVNEKIVAAALAIHDVTELQRLSRSKRDFVANISHELRTPLASIQLLVETLLNGALNDNDLAFDLTNKMVPQVDILRQLAQELLDLSLIESGQAPLKMSSYPLLEIIQTQVEQIFPQAERKGITLEIDIADDIEVLVDKTMVGRVLTNLLHNAIKFTETGGVKISALVTKSGKKKKDKESWVTVSIADTGVGILTEELPRIFERFYKIDRSRSGKKSGTGLGLAIAKHIVEAHGGRIWVESDGRSGTTFYLTFPLE